MRGVANGAARLAWLAALLGAAACSAPGDGDGRPAESGDAARAVTAPAERPRLAVGERLGAAEAPVEVIEFSDLGCTSCSHFAREAFPALREEFVESGRVQWRYVLVDRGFPNGVPASRAARCAGAQGRFWEMRAILAREQRDWIVRRDPSERFRGYAAEAGLDDAEFAACYARPEPRGMTTTEMVAQSLGVVAVPTFLVDGRRVIGALGREQFRAILLEALAARGG